ncbi:MAG: nitrous oxide reductase family maturation protein NosD [Gammaproteobacteria bacterium]|nr:nitrous oxide reductase family maturation protein NosD [Gammaproteobacteria bacterium]
MKINNLSYIKVLFLFILFPFTLHAEVISVSPDSEKTLQEFINEANENDVIELSSGIYRGNVRVDKPVSLRASSSSEQKAVILDGAGKGRVIEIFSSSVSIKGLKIINSGDEVGKMDACVYVHKEAAHVRIQDNVLEKCAFGIWVNGSADIQITKNVISGVKRKYPSDMGNGINLWQVSDSLIRENRISSVRDGIFLTVTKGSIVRNNYVHDVRFGVHYMYNDDNIIISNHVCNSSVGLAMMYSKRLKINNNITINNKQHGVLFRSIYDSKVKNNLASGNARGFFLNDASFNQITENQVENNEIGVHVTAGSNDNKVYDNNFVANQVQVMYATRYSQDWNIESKGNYWSDYLGWDFDQNNIGDRIYYASNRIDQLAFRYPQIKLLAQSPVIQLFQFIESRFPVARPASVIDRLPYMKPVNVGYNAERNELYNEWTMHCEAGIKNKND